MVDHLRNYAGPATGIVELDAGALARNYARLQSHAAPARCAATVKADAYGLGASDVVPTLSAAGCDTFFVAGPREGLAVRACAPDATIYILDGLLPGMADFYLHHDLRPCIGTLDEFDQWGGQTDAPAAIHIDTGMNRLGLSPAECATLAGDEARRSATTVALIMSHLACGDDPAHPLNARQMTAFEQARTLFAQAATSFSNSAGTLTGLACRFDLARPGISLFGASALNDREKETEPVATLYARILQIRDNWTEATIGYGATRSLDGVRRIATLGVGYADGIPRHLSSRDGLPDACVFCAGHRVPIIGRISMDLVTIDVSAVPDADVARGDWVEIFGRNIDIDAQATRAGTIGYELLTRLGPRYERRVIPHTSSPSDV